MADINYSIIIPHKNIPDLLRRCLNSIPRRDDIQIIVVDDNSDEDKVDFKHFPGVGEKCVEVYFTKEGRGAGYARNVGLKHAKGKWLLFADADDFYNQHFIEVLDTYKDADIDILYYSVNSVDSDTLEVSDRGNDISNLVDNIKDINSHELELLRYSLWVPWNKMFKADFIHALQLTFDEIVAGNDALFVVKAGHFAKNIQVAPQKIYCVTYRRNSLTYKRSRKSLEAAFDMRLRLNDFLCSVGKQPMCVLLYGTIWHAYKVYGAKEALRLGKMVGQKKQIRLFFKQICGRMNRARK